MSNSFYHKDLTDAQWNRIKIVFEEKPKVGRPPLNPRTVFNALMWILKSGARWRDLPSRYGNWNSIYHKIRLWCRLGLFERLMKIINADKDNSILLELDSTFCKVHQSACSALKEQAIGSSRGGKNTKIHVLLNERMQLLKVILTGGQIHDSEPALHYFLELNSAVKKFLRIYSSKHMKDFFSESKITATSPPATTNWLVALRILFYLLLVLFTFNLPTTPNHRMNFVLDLVLCLLTDEHPLCKKF